MQDRGGDFAFSTGSGLSKAKKYHKLAPHYITDVDFSGLDFCWRHTFLEIEEGCPWRPMGSQSRRSKFCQSDLQCMCILDLESNERFSF